MSAAKPEKEAHAEARFAAEQHAKLSFWKKFALGIAVLLFAVLCAPLCNVVSSKVIFAEDRQALDPLGFEDAVDGAALSTQGDLPDAGIASSYPPCNVNGKWEPCKPPVAPPEPGSICQICGICCARFALPGFMRNLPPVPPGPEGGDGPR